MPNYQYTAISKTGEHISGKDLAKDEYQLARMLKEQGYVLVRAEPSTPSSKGFALFRIFSGFFGVPLTEKLLFMRSLQLMVASGIALPKTLEVLREQTKSRKLKKALEDIKEKVLKGHQLSEAMGEHPAIFSDLFVNMLKVGEESGTLENVLSHLTLQLEREHDLRSKIQGALMYPAVIIVAMMVIGILMLIIVVPNLAKTFQELNINLPPSTRFVIGLGDFLLHRWYLAILLLGGFVVLLSSALRTKTGKYVFDTITLRAPIVSALCRKIQAAFTARTLSSLIGAGVPIVRSLEITSSVLGNIYFRQALLSAAGRVRKGERLSQVMEEYKNLYPLVVVQMIEVGEETGRTQEILAKLAEFFEEEVSNITKNLASIIEPVLMLIIGAVVGFFAISMIQPMYSMLQGVQ